MFERQRKSRLHVEMATLAQGVHFSRLPRHQSIGPMGMHGMARCTRNGIERMAGFSAAGVTDLIVVAGHTDPVGLGGGDL